MLRYPIFFLQSWTSSEGSERVNPILVAIRLSFVGRSIPSLRYFPAEIDYTPSYASPSWFLSSRISPPTQHNPYSPHHSVPRMFPTSTTCRRCIYLRLILRNMASNVASPPNTPTDCDHAIRSSEPACNSCRHWRRWLSTDKKTFTSYSMQ
jgi:hypothetical protein